MTASNNVTTILIVDDDQDILDVLDACLSDLPCEVLTVNTPAAAIEAISTKEIAMLICDLHMGDDNIDGNTILAAARIANPDMVSILMSGMMDRDAMITALNSGGVSKYLEKPLDMTEVRRLVDEGVERYLKQVSPRHSLSAIAGTTTVIMKQALTGSGPSKIHMPDPPVTDIPHRTGELIDDRYKLVAVLGTGRTGVVYLAEDAFLSANVALKVLNQEFTKSEDEIAVLKAEARIAMTLSHRNIVRLYNFDKADNDHFLVMEYVDGCSLRHVLVQDGKLPMESLALVVRSASSAMSYAHEHGVIHQDLKPDNLLLSREGIIKIIDFGLACLIDKQVDSDYIVGTPVYMSPEQKRGEPLTPQSDIYSLGIVTYELATGRYPFPEDASHMDVLNMEACELSGLPSRMKHVLERATASNAEDRYKTAAVFADAFINAASLADDIAPQASTRRISKAEEES